MGTKARRATGAEPAPTTTPRPAAPNAAPRLPGPLPAANPGRNLGGRPPIEVTPDDLRRLETMARNLIREDTMATILGWSPDTLTRRKRDTPEVLRVLKKGYAEAELLTGNKLMEGIRRGNLGAIVWAEKSRFGYRERMEVAGPGGGPVPHEDVGKLSPNERQARIAQLLAAGSQRAGA